MYVLAARPEPRGNPRLLKVQQSMTSSYLNSACCREGGEFNRSSFCTRQPSSLPHTPSGCDSLTCSRDMLQSMSQLALRARTRTRSSDGHGHRFIMNSFLSRSQDDGVL